MMWRWWSLSWFLVMGLVPVAVSGQVTALEELDWDRGRPPDMEEILSIRERFVYEVRYGFFRLGEIEVELLPDTTVNGKQLQQMRTVIRSGSGIPFLRNRHVRYANIFHFDRNAIYSHRFWRDDLHDNEPMRADIQFDREQMEVRFYERGEPRDTLELVEPASGGDIIFFYARMFAGEDVPYALPVFISEDGLGEVRALSSRETEIREYDAFDEPVATYRSDGVADIDGPFGFTGDFSSWFLTDDRRIPLEAHVKVLFGNLKISLISYEQIGKREGGGPVSETAPHEKPTSSGTRE
ncbi:MAG: DUF3108 domain-containing protein [Bacteroidota bacterium]